MACSHIFTFHGINWDVDGEKQNPESSGSCCAALTVLGLKVHLVKEYILTGLMPLYFLIDFNESGNLFNGISFHRYLNFLNFSASE